MFCRSYSAWWYVHLCALQQRWEAGHQPWKWALRGGQLLLQLDFCQAFLLIHGSPNSANIHTISFGFEIFVFFFFPSTDLTGSPLTFVLNLFHDLLFNTFSTPDNESVFYSAPTLKIFISDFPLTSESISAVWPGFPVNYVGIHTFFITNLTQPANQSQRSQYRKSHQPNITVPSTWFIKSM